MAKKIRYWINGKPFSSQSAMKKHFQSILKSAAIGEPVSGDTFGDCISLFQRHPEWQSKSGVGIKDIVVRKNPVFNDRCFWIYRTDGTDTDISYLTCLSGRKKTGRSEFMAACRNAIVDQVLSYKRERFREFPIVRCEITGRMVSERDAEIDHVTPFCHIVDLFISERSIDISSVKYIGNGDGEITTDFADVSLMSDWQSFHRKNARLQVTHREANQAKGSKVL